MYSSKYWYLLKNYKNHHLNISIFILSHILLKEKMGVSMLRELPI